MNTHFLFVILLMIIPLLLLFQLLPTANVLFLSAQKQQPNTNTNEQTNAEPETIKTIHVFVALCDNENQGIVPVPPKIGNGEDYHQNLYWGCGYGVRTYFRKSNYWKEVGKLSPDSIRLERLVFRSLIDTQVYLLAEAYKGAEIKTCMNDFICSAHGHLKTTDDVKGKTLSFGGNAELLAYIGHNGLLEFGLDKPDLADQKIRKIIALACYSKHSLSQYCQHQSVQPLVLSTGLMAPEAYTLHDALNAYIKNQPIDSIRMAAASAYHRYQKCGLKAAKNLLKSGWD